MGNAFNVMVSSVSKKVPLVASIYKAMNKLADKGKVIGADADPLCLSKFFVDQFYCMKKLSDIDRGAFYADCQQLRVNCLIPTRDGELEFYAKYKEDFSKHGIEVMISELSAISLCLDKYHFHEKLKDEKFPVIPTALNFEEIKASHYVVKERFGSGSANIGLKLTEEEAKKHAEKLKNPVFQPFISGQEVSVDLYLDKAYKVKGVVARRRELIVNGESQVTTSFRDQSLEERCSHLAEKLNLQGHVMFQLIYDSENEDYFFIECNPRFGGASTLSLEVGLDSFYWFFNETQGKTLLNIPFLRSPEEKTLVRYPKDRFI